VLYCQYVGGFLVLQFLLAYHFFHMHMIFKFLIFSISSFELFIIIVVVLGATQ
jgi:hypothetical protein